MEGLNERARAGRDRFLPGGRHERRTGALPVEEWKLPHYEPMRTAFDAFLPDRPFDHLFRDVSTGVRGGKGPRYERVR
ncbi:MAG: hypothetical protein Q8P41_12200 [Pseudomonadota bacterium]|nr:hypothetical protein [Pseudomonadota bacterium]